MVNVQIAKDFETSSDFFSTHHGLLVSSFCHYTTSKELTADCRSILIHFVSCSLKGVILCINMLAFSITCLFFSIRLSLLHSISKRLYRLPPLCTQHLSPTKFTADFFILVIPWKNSVGTTSDIRKRISKNTRLCQLKQANCSLCAVEQSCHSVLQRSERTCAAWHFRSACSQMPAKSVTDWSDYKYGTHIEAHGIHSTVRLLIQQRIHLTHGNIAYRGSILTFWPAG